ncbi:uncharacterized protein TM35_000321470 [Trypanosoma theileri]|uniref:Uncharacterized protein n=1 Tax=Trypanosoma theileri TaxID=67003 RepID=A0A1X0NM69_9TRYP|nr:uncharacterized protein TM35_000321470 [Trypanosoma theileri]ORC85832.1 hypothetical protein TM35_000321470 [Trypanosoma theileri]
MGAPSSPFSGTAPAAPVFPKEWGPLEAILFFCWLAGRAVQPRRLFCGPAPSWGFCIWENGFFFPFLEFWRPAVSEKDPPDPTLSAPERETGQKGLLGAPIPSVPRAFRVAWLPGKSWFFFFLLS